MVFRPATETGRECREEALREKEVDRTRGRAGGPNSSIELTEVELGIGTGPL